jgi:hypothetical protein
MECLELHVQFYYYKLKIPLDPKANVLPILLTILDGLYSIKMYSFV